MKIEILNKAKKKKLLQNTQEFGIAKIPELLIRTGRERIRAFSGSLSTEEIYDLWRILPIEGIGLYVAKDAINKKSGEHETRISLDGLHAWQKQIDKKNSILSMLGWDISVYNDIIIDKAQPFKFVHRNIDTNIANKLNIELA